MLRNTLPGCEALLQQLGLPEDVRPQQVDMPSYVKLFKALRAARAGGGEEAMDTAAR